MANLKKPSILFYGKIFRKYLKSIGFKIIVTYLIVGIDPGITTAIVFLDLKGNVLSAYSGKNLKISDIIKKITEVGKPVIVACDVKYPPATVYKITSKFNVITFCPDRDLKVGEKERIVKRNFPFLKLRNVHERDALSAAISAYKAYEGLFNKVEEHLKNSEKEELIPIVKKKLVLKEAKNISDALTVEEQKIPKEKKIRTPQEEIIKKLVIEKNRLIEEIKKLEGRKPVLKTKVLEPEKFKIFLKDKEELIRLLEKRINELNSLNENLKEDTDSLKETEKLIKNGFTIVKELKDLSGFFDLNKKLGLYKDILYVENLFYPKNEIIKFLKENGISTLIYKSIKDREKFERDSFILIQDKDINIKGEKIKYIDKNEISKISLHKKILEKVINEYKRERK